MIISLVAIVLLFTLVMLGLPISFALFMIGYAGVWFLKGFGVANSVVHYAPLGAVLAGEVSTLPLFILIGAIALSAGVASDGFKVARAWLGRMPGGLGVATITASSVFAACSGSATAGAVTMGKLTIPEMKANRYSGSLAAGIVGAGGLMATTIPPSGMLVLYGIVSNESIGKLLIAGVIPGIVLTLMFAGAIVLAAILYPQSAPLSKETYTWKERFRVLPRLWGVVVIFGTIFLGLFTGFFTPNESAAWGTLFAAVLLFVRARKRFFREFFKACVDSALITVSIFFLVLGAFVFSNFLIIAGLPEQISKTVVSLEMPPFVVLTVIISTFFVLGMFMDGVTITLLAVPIYYPVITQIGFDGIWFGIILVSMTDIGCLTPPFGIVAYVINAISPEINLVEVFKGCFLFVIIDLLCVILLCFFPEIVTWLPSLMG